MNHHLCWMDVLDDFLDRVFYRFTGWSVFLPRDIKQNRFPEPTRVKQPTAAQGDVHWLDWHEEKP